jgi:hypothetical protein
MRIFHIIVFQSPVNKNALSPETEERAVVAGTKIT